MKTSNILLISFLSFIALVCILFLFPAPEEVQEEKENKMVQVDYPVAAFKYLKVDKGCSVELKDLKDGDWKISNWNHKDSVPVSPEFVMMGDTLHIKSIKGYKRITAELYCGEFISYDGSGYVRISKEQDSLMVKPNGGKVTVLPKSKITALTVNATGGRVYCQDDELKLLHATMTDSKLEVNSRKMEVLNVSLENNASLITRSALEMNIKRGEGSRVRVN